MILQALGTEKFPGTSACRALKNSLMVTLQDVTILNWRDCIRLSLHEPQVGFVASNVATIAESRFNPHYHLRAIYADEQLVGMLAFCHEDEPEDLELYWIFRLMIDRTQQGNGYGVEAIRLVIDEIRTLGGKRIKTMHKPDNVAASVSYTKLGFRSTGRLDDGDCLLELEIPLLGAARG
jgi:diamine N-acetyltransferase